jgi:AraC-like DNA-binding protein
VRNEPIFYEDGKDWRIVDLRPHGVDCVPLFAFGNFGAVRPGAKLHVHSGCVEVCLCLKGNVRYETDGMMYPVLPGHVFISRPDEPHRRCDNPKGMMLYRILFAMPRRGECVLGLSSGESAFIAGELRKIPFRVFHATPRLRAAFVRLFAVFDADAAGRTRHRLEMRNAALELLLALVEAPYVPYSANGRPSAKVKAIARRIADSPELEYPVAALAREASLSSFAFTEAFKRETGLTPHAYLVDQRVRRAYDDLRAHRGSIRMISVKWRFSSPQHMSAAFRRILGITPSMVV